MVRPSWQPEMYDPHNVGPTWKPHMATGIAWQDQQHQELLGKLDELVQAVQYHAGASVVEELLDFLNKYSAMHFEMEEQYMADSKCSTCAQHHACHEQFKQQLRDVRELYEHHGPSTLVVMKLQTWLRRWLTNHILTLDRNLGNPAAPDTGRNPSG